MDFLNLLDEYKDDMIKTLQELIAIPSVKGEPLENAPFGEAVDQAHQFMLKMAEKDGFDAFNADNYGGHIEYGGYEYDENGEVISRSNEIMGILVHLDVVPEGSGWDFPPFSGEIHDGRLYGRGSIDDKGPAIAAYYGMKALKGAGIMPKKRVRLILGLDEETGWEGMRYYLKKTQAPDFGFAPDAEFPVIHGEKGIMVFELAKKFGKTAAKGLILRKIEGGSAPNMVPDFAKALVRGDDYEEIKERLNEFREATGYKLYAKGRGKSLEISAEGVSAHGSTPEKGVNAISVLMEFLGKLSFNSDDTSEFIEFYNEKIGHDYHGENIGCGLYDDISGKLAFNPGMIYMDEEAVRITVNVRYPLTLDEEQVYSGMLPVITPLNMGIIKIEHKAPIYIPKEHSLIKTLMTVYQDHTGDIESEPMIIGGGTYARAAKNIVAYGMNFPGEPEVQHQKNEYILLETFMKGAKIYADAIYKLTCLD